MKLLICDKDGTLTTTKSGETFVQHPEDQELLPGVAQTIARYRAEGWAIAIASNQGGVADGHKTLGSAIDEMFFAMNLTGIDTAMAAHSYENEYGEAIFFDLSDGGMQWDIVTNKKTRFRKPAGGMIDYLAAQLHGTRLWRDDVEVLFVGDRTEDEQAAQAARVDFMWASDWVEK
jgi:D-glycero-D-manno-heptose 1,7-bisphosphate phosphatase